jgi:hypothetical protein
MITYLSNEKNIILRWSIYRRFSKVLDIALKNQKLKNQLQLYGFHYPICFQCLPYRTYPSRRPWKMSFTEHAVQAVS